LEKDRGIVYASGDHRRSQGVPGRMGVEEGASKLEGYTGMNFLA